MGTTETIGETRTTQVSPCSRSCETQAEKSKPDPHEETSEE